MPTIKRYIPHLLVAGVTLGGILIPSLTVSILRDTAAWFLRNFEGLTLGVASVCVLVCVWIALSPMGRQRIGGAEARPEFRTLTWLSMLFAAGMGSGMVFWGTAEPVIHAVSPPPGSEGLSPEALRRQSLALTQFHWSVHAWSIYAVGALAVAVATARNQPPLPSAPFGRLSPRWRRLIDWGALGAVIFGLVASFGQGVFQMGAGVEKLSGGAIANGLPVQLTLLAVLTVAYLGSAATGLRRGIAILSNLNMGLVFVLAAFVLIAGPTGAILQTLGETAGAYVSSFGQLSVDIRPEGAGRAWTRDWSLTYFLWWVAWTPFVGVFVARISRGRRVRDFILGVILAPVMVTLVWFSIFGGAGLYFEAQGIDLGVRDFATAPAATYSMLSHLPLASLTQGMTLVLVFLFLLTSADSGAYVLGMFSTGTNDPVVGERLFWGLVMAILTVAAILSEGGQAATRAFAVTGAIPLTFLLAAQGVSLMMRRRDRS